MKERCNACPILEKIGMYKIAGQYPVLAEELAKEQGIFTPADITDKSNLLQHFDRTADMLIMGCKNGLLCRGVEWL